MKKSILIVIAIISLCSFTVVKPAPADAHITWMTWEEGAGSTEEKAEEESFCGCVYRLVWLVQTNGCNNF